MAICGGDGFPDLRDKHPTTEDFNKLAKAITDHIFRDVFENDHRHHKYRNGGYAAAAEVGVGPKGFGERSHHMVNQATCGYLGSNADMIAMAKGVGFDSISQDQVNSMIHHPLNVVNVPGEEHGKITTQYNMGDFDKDVSHLYEYERLQSFQDQMVSALKALHSHSPDHGWQNYLDKVDYFRNQSF